MLAQRTIINESTKSEQVLMTEYPVHTNPTIRDGHYLGPKPNSYFPLAIISTILNPLLGPVAIFYARKSDTAYNDRDIENAKKWAKYAFRIALSAIVFSIVLAAVLIIALIGLRDDYTRGRY